MHDIVWVWRAVHPLRRVLLKAFEVSHEPLHSQSCSVGQAVACVWSAVPVCVARLLALREGVLMTRPPDAAARYRLTILGDWRIGACGDGPAAQLACCVELQLRPCWGATKQRSCGDLSEGTLSLKEERRTSKPFLCFCCSSCTTLQQPSTCKLYCFKNPQVSYLALCHRGMTLLQHVDPLGSQVVQRVPRQLSGTIRCRLVRL